MGRVVGEAPGSGTPHAEKPHDGASQQESLRTVFHRQLDLAPAMAYTLREN
jgi:hypothetical protein